MDARQIAAARNALVPFLDLFGRLEDADLCKLSGAPREIVADMRSRVKLVQDALGHRRGLLDELTDAELVQITGADERTIRFWRMTERPPGQRIAPQEAAASNPGAPSRAPSAAPVATRPAPTPQPAKAKVDDEREVSADPGLGDALRHLMATQSGSYPRVQETPQDSPARAAYPDAPEGVDGGFGSVFGFEDG